MAFFNYIDLKYNQLNDQINAYLRDLYSRSNEIFSNASPFGQITNMLKEFFQFSTIYQKNIVRNIDVETATNIKVMRSLSRISGHNPTRMITATGTLKFTLKQRVNLTDDIVGGLIKVQDKTSLLNKTNGLEYSLRVGREVEIFRLSSSYSFFINVVQGKYEEQTFTGDGTINQSFSVNVPSLSEIDNFDVEVLYNGSSLTIRDSQYDMLKNERACFVRTGINGGVDVYFGNGNYGFIPDAGGIITVKYLLTNGTLGNILTPVDNDFVFTTPVYDDGDNVLNMDDNFDISVSQDIQFSSNGASISSLSSILPNVSRNFVLATASQYIYHLGRLQLFSKITI